ncbi:hypothetical protein [Natrinema salinisoli]|uniref:hypothetical protein n=1 Tax=Natrinema salinisoli TaxID=2878535 RepID=UPI001CF0343B|nr:hypothetical protein [Natrinema salinisoli]
MDFPEITKFEEVKIDAPTSVVTVAGFEDRAKAIFEELASRDDADAIQTGAGIRYKPFNERNDVEGMKNGMASIGLSDDSTESLVFDRHDPDSFEPIFEAFLESISEEHILLDISGMSKLLIMVTLDILAEKDYSVTIFYAEAKVYTPTKDEYTDTLQSRDDSDRTPAFLTHGIYDIVTSRGLSSALGSDQPMIVVAFPTFNHQELMALASELSPTQLVSIEGIPNRKEDYWRKESIRELNEGVESHIHVDWRETSTFDYGSTTRLLNNIYNEYGDKYRMILAPTGSKLQTVGCLIFRRQHQDTQIVYPVTREFSETYSQGWKATWGIELGNIDDKIVTDGEEYQQKISELRSKIEDINDSVKDT